LTAHPMRVTMLQSFRYDEIVFTDPQEGFFRLLVAGQQAAVPLHEHGKLYRYFSDASDVQALTAARQYVHSELQAVEERIMRVDAQIKAAGGAAPAAAAAAAAAGDSGGASVQV
jgi:hypothetical protein